LGAFDIFPLWLTVDTVKVIDILFFELADERGLKTRSHKPSKTTHHTRRRLIDDVDKKQNRTDQQQQLLLVDENNCLYYHDGLDETNNHLSTHCKE
jgi:hypothetical protein